MVSTITKKDIYRDLDNKFFPHPETGAVSVLKNAEAIKQQVKNLIFTNRYETLFQPKVFGGINEALFDSFDPITVQTIKTAIKDVISNYATRAELLEITLTNRLEEYNAIEVTVVVKPINLQSPITINFFLERTR